MNSLSSSPRLTDLGFVDFSNLSPDSAPTAPNSRVVSPDAVPDSSTENIWNAARRQFTYLNEGGKQADDGKQTPQSGSRSTLDSLTHSPITVSDSRSSTETPTVDLDQIDLSLDNIQPINALRSRQVRSQLPNSLDTSLQDLVVQYLGVPEMEEMAKISFLPMKADLHSKIESRMGQNTALAVSSKICDYIEAHWFDWDVSVAKDGINLYIPASDELPRPVQYNTDGSIFIHFTKAKQGDPSLGKGTYKNVKFALHYPDGNWYASSGIKNTDRAGYEVGNNEGHEEITGLLTVQGLPGLIQMLYAVGYNNKAGTLKTRIITPLYQHGTLQEMIKNGGLDLANKLIVAEHLIIGLYNLHGIKYLHRDLKPANVLLGESACISDLGTMCKAVGDYRLGHNCTSPWWASPEYAKAKVAGTSLEKVTTYKHDIWALGCILYDLIHCPIGHNSCRPWIGDTDITLMNLTTLDASWFPEPKDKKSLDHLIWEMLSIDPAQRPEMPIVFAKFTACTECK